MLFRSHAAKPPVIEDKSVSLRTSVPPQQEAVLNAKIMIENAGTFIVNGVYTSALGENGLVMYTKGIYWDGRCQSICLFRCKVQNQRTRWFISAVPFGTMPSTSRRHDYYHAPATADNSELPN